MMYIIDISSFAKGNSGPLKLGIQTVEDIIVPVYNKPSTSLSLSTTSPTIRCLLQNSQFRQQQFDETTQHLDKHVTGSGREVWGTVKKVPELARSVAGEVKHSDVIGTATGAIKAVYETCSPVARDLYV